MPRKEKSLLPSDDVLKTTSAAAGSVSGSVLSPLSWVRARIWGALSSAGEASSAKGVIKEGMKSGEQGHVGHASVEVSSDKPVYFSRYFSFWPAAPIGGLKSSTVSESQLKTGLEILESNPALLSAEQREMLLGAMREANRNRYVADRILEISEGRTPEMDERDEGGRKPTNMSTFYSLDAEAVSKKYEELKKDAYVLKAKANPKLAQPEAQNCSSMAYALLRAGGINRLSPRCAALEKSVMAITPDDLRACVEDAKKEELRLYPDTVHYEVRKPGM